ncbi:MAG: putative sulfate exporter family transporter [Candidatus Hydrothermarchaeaceae archaeon]
MAKEGLLPEGWPLAQLPGFLLLVVVGTLGIWISQPTNAFMSSLIAPGEKTVKGVFHYLLGTIVLGVIIANTVGVPKWAEKGVATYKFWLYAGIVALGGRLSLEVVIGKAPVILIMAPFKIIFTIAVASWLVSKMALADTFGTTLITAVSICGVSAAVGTAGAIGAKEEEMGYTVAAILLWGAITLLVLPYLGLVLGLNPAVFGIWAGVAVHNTAQAVAVGSIYDGFLEAGGQESTFNDLQTVDYATLTKMVRNAFMGLVILYFAMMHAKLGSGGKEIKYKGRFLWDKFPKFIIGFFIVMLLATVGALDKTAVKASKNMYGWLFTWTFAGVGLRTKISDMTKCGKEPAIMYGVTKLIVASTTLLILYMLFTPVM